MNEVQTENILIVFSQNRAFITFSFLNVVFLTSLFTAQRDEQPTQTPSLSTTWNCKTPGVTNEILRKSIVSRA